MSCSFFFALISMLFMTRRLRGAGLKFKKYHETQVGRVLEPSSNRYWLFRLMVSIEIIIILLSTFL